MPTDSNTGESLPQFDASHSSTMSRYDRYYSFVKNWVITPGRIVISDWRGIFGLTILIGYLLMGSIGVMLVSAPSGQGPRLASPFEVSGYPLGTDTLGNNLLGLVVHSTPPMFIMIGAGAIFSTILATSVGALAGYKRGRIDSVLTAITDVFIALPGLPLIIIITALFNPNHPALIGIILTINAWAGLARSVRSQVLSIRSNAYVEASRIMDVSTVSILIRDIIPNLMPYITINFVKSSRLVIFNSVALYFLGLLPFTTLNWGVMLNMAYRNGALYSWSTAYWLFIPMVAIVLLVLGLLMLGQSLDRVFNPRTRTRTMED